jgi:hypothetical protein
VPAQPSYVPIIGLLKFEILEPEYFTYEVRIIQPSMFEQSYYADANCIDHLSAVRIIPVVRANLP